MCDFILELYKREIAFRFDGKNIILGEYDTGFYGIVETTVTIDEVCNTYWVEYGHKGYPYSEELKTIDELIDFIEELH